MPLPMKSIREVAAELGMTEREVRVLIDTNKVRAVWKKSQLAIAPDEIARLRRMRKTLPESAVSAPPVPAKGPAAIDGKGGSPKAGSGQQAAAKRPGLKLPPPPNLPPQP